MITYDSGINIALPPKYRNLSRGGGEIQIIKESDKKIVLFYAYRGILDNYSVYAFVPNKESYEILEKSENWNTITTIDDKWYFCTSN